MSTSTIKAALGTKLIRNASSFFRNDLTAILDECVQNSRRAGATLIRFSFSGCDLIVEDDGTGLAKEDAQVLLTLGSSEWGGGIEREEAAAGIGFFALAHHDVEVRTQDWSCAITPDNFVGIGEVTLETGLPDHYGMRLTIKKILPDGDPETQEFARVAANDKIQKATIHSGLVCLIAEGHYTSRHEPKAFLECYAKWAHASSRIGQIPGARIRVVRIARSKLDTDDTGRFILNFFGKSLIIDEWEIPARMTPKHPFEDWVLSRREGGVIEQTKIRTLVLVDVDGATSVRLRLPDRDSIVDTPELERVAEMADLLLAETLRDGHPNGIAITEPYRDETSFPGPTTLVRAIGRESGEDDAIAVPAPTPTNPSACVLVDRDGMTIPLGSIALFNEDRSWFGGLFHHATRMTDGRIMRIYDGNSMKTAISVESLSRIVAVSIEIAYDTGTIAIESDGDELEYFERYATRVLDSEMAEAGASVNDGRRPRSITAAFAIVEADGTQTWSEKVPQKTFCLTDEGDEIGDFSEPYVIVAADTPDDEAMRIVRDRARKTHLFHENNLEDYEINEAAEVNEWESLSERIRRWELAAAHSIKDRRIVLSGLERVITDALMNAGYGTPRLSVRMDVVLERGKGLVVTLSDVDDERKQTKTKRTSRDAPKRTRKPTGPTAKGKGH